MDNFSWQKQVYRKNDHHVTDIELYRIYHAVALDEETSHCETGLDTTYVDTHTTASPHTFQQSARGEVAASEQSLLYAVW